MVSTLFYVFSRFSLIYCLLPMAFFVSIVTSSGIKLMGLGIPSNLTTGNAILSQKDHQLNDLGGFTTPALTEHFVESGFDTQDLLRTMCKSRTYQHSIESNRWSDADN